ncbi:polysaccharide pyruvyl transferase family protein [Corynebacteriaceae bacterium 6-324]
MIKSRSWLKNRQVCVFYSVAAQEDNLGDIAIRLRMLNWLKGSADVLIVYTGPMSESYLQPFGFDDRIDLTHSKPHILIKLLRALVQYRVFLVLPPGPSGFGGARNMLRSLATIVANLVLNIGGGGILQVGTAYRGAGRISVKLHELKTALYHLCVVRDSKSIASNRTLTAPDLAFEGWESTENLQRTRLSVSLRSDYEVDENVLQQFRTISENNGWKLTFVSQVQRDDARHRELALKYGADVISWEGNHGAQFERVKAAYSESIAVLSDRLHGLIFSSNMGALPIALVHSGNDKLTSTFQLVIDLPRVNSGSDEIPNSVIESIHTHSIDPEPRMREMQESRMKLKDIKMLVLEALK